MPQAKFLNFTTNLNFKSIENQMLLIQGIRLGFLSTILVITLLFQIIQKEFISLEIIIPIYGVLLVSYFFNTVYLLWIERLINNKLTTAVLFYLDALLFTVLVYYVRLNQSLFLFLYLVNIILCGFVFGRKGSRSLAFFTSILFNFLLVIGPEQHGQTLIFTVILNNLSFFVLAELSGILSEQLDFMGVELQAKSLDLKKLKDLNKIIIQNIATGLITLDREGVIIQSNLAARKILETDEDLIGKTIDQITPGVFLKISQNFKGDKDLEVVRVEQDHEIRKDDKRVLEFIASLVKENEGRRSGYILLFQDLTQLKRLELSMRQNEKLAAVGQLAAGIAHEIRNPLASISGSIQLLESVIYVQSDEEKKLMKIALKEIDRLNNLISEFLDFVKPDSPPQDKVDLTLVLKEVLDLLQLNMELDQRIKQTRDFFKVSFIKGQKDKLRQAFLNICINAYQSMDKSNERTLKVTVKEENEYVVVRIQDSGCGINSSLIKRIFEPFLTTKAKGTGLGLAITHKILMAHGAQVFVDSKEEVGTLFTLQFPIDFSHN